jgi:hypothetical protein
MFFILNTMPPKIVISIVSEKKVLANVSPCYTTVPGTQGVEK